MPFKNDKQRKAAFARLNANRTQQAINSDLGKRAVNTLPYSADNVKAWRSDPSRIDIEGIDTPILKIEKPDKFDDIDVSKEYRYSIPQSTKSLYEIPIPDDIHGYVTKSTDEDKKSRAGVDTIVTFAPLPDEFIHNYYLNEHSDVTLERQRNEYLAKSTLSKEQKMKIVLSKFDNIDEVKQAVDKLSTDERNKITTDFKVDTSLINEDLARHSHSGTSFDPELRAKQEIESFEIEMKNTYKVLSEGAKTLEQKAILNEEMQRYQENYAKKWNELLSSKSRIISPMITGPANFPVRRNQKANDAYHNKYGKFMEWNSKARGSISSKIERHEKQKQIEAAGGEVALMKQNLKKLEDHQEDMKAANKIIRKKITEEERVDQLEKMGVKAGMGKLLIETGGYETYQLTNNNANIKRMKDRVVDMEKKESTPTSTTKFSGGEIIDNNQADWVQIFFDEKPDAEMRGKLKGSGWRWSPSNVAWQRKRTNAALHSAQQITD